MAHRNGTRTQPDSTDQCAKVIASVDTSVRARRQTIRTARQILSPVVVIPHNPSRHLESDASGRDSHHTTMQNSLKINCDSDNLLIYSPTSTQQDPFVESRIKNKSRSNHDDSEDTSTTTNLYRDSSKGESTPPAAKRPRRSDSSLDTYRPNQMSLARVTRSERPMTRSSFRSGWGLANRARTKKVEFGLMDPDLSKNQANHSHYVAHSSSSTGSRGSPTIRKPAQREGPEAPPKRMMTQDDHPVVNVEDNMIESTQELTDKAKNFSTDKLLKLNRLTASLLEERLLNKNPK